MLLHVLVLDRIFRNASPSLIARSVERWDNCVGSAVVLLLTRPFFCSCSHHPLPFALGTFIDRFALDCLNILLLSQRVQTGHCALQGHCPVSLVQADAQG